jgi:RNA polymerase sigma-70 factor (ECF subfamily)
MKEADVRAELERHHADSFGWALHCCRRNAEEAEDVLQASYLKVIDGRARYDGRSGFKTWLFGVIRRTAAESRRSRLVRDGLRARFAQSAPDRTSSSHPLDAVARDETTKALLEGLEALSARQRDVLHLVFYQDLSIQEAAGVLRIAVGTARTHYERGKTALRARLDREAIRG